MKEEIVEIYTDGNCKGNPGPGGWGVVMTYKSKRKTMNGGEKKTTNNRMELTAAIEALTNLSRPCKVVLSTDSSYLKNGITKWIKSWKRNNWKTSTKAPVKNQELWEELDALVAHHDVEWRWVKGHSGVPGNEMADSLANQAIDQLLSQKK